MTTKTRRDLVTHALGDLGILSAGQTPEAEDFDTVDEHVEPTIAMLAARDIPGIPDVDGLDEIAPEVFLPLATLLADQAASHFGLVGVPAPPGVDPVLEAETRLREIGYSRPTYDPQRTEWF